MKDKTIKEWTQELAAKDGKYGGGSGQSCWSICGQFGSVCFPTQQGKENMLTMKIK